MTNTLHRFGDAASFYDDYVVFAIPSRGKNEVVPILERLGYKLESAKTNVGLGRITNVIEAQKPEKVTA